MNPRLRKVLRYFLIVLALAVVVRMYLRITDDFRISNITYEIPYHAEWEIPALAMDEQSKIDTILLQKFSYVGKGAQSYVFVSEDNNYVIKFFKFKHLKPSLVVSLMPEVFPFRDYKQHTIERKQYKFNSVFNGYRLAYDKHREESGLLFLQLNPTKVKKTVTVFDKIGLQREIDLGEVVYVIQKRCDTLRTVLTNLMKKNDLNAVKQTIGRVLDLYFNEYSKGVYDRDHGIMHNIGFFGEEPIHIDLGKFSSEERLKDPDFAKDDMRIVVNKMDVWFKTNFPQHHAEMMSFIENKIN